MDNASRHYFNINSTNYHIRPIHPHDFNKGHLKLLAQLTTVGEYGIDEYNEFISLIKKNSNTYHILVIEDTDHKLIVGTGTLLIEQKLIHNLGRVGHIEDIVVDKYYQGLGLGKTIIDALVEKSREMACYKVILDCNSENVKFYEKCGFNKNGVEMRLTI
jgi:glucosamine-phosphate N-acetyltransferase